MTQKWQSHNEIYMQHEKIHTRYWFYALLLLLLIVLFLPWTQTIRSKGNVIALRQEQRPQEINTVIPGKIIKWHVKEGDMVKTGDTLLQLSEIKDNYLDPKLLDRTREQINAKKNSINFYRNKVNTAESQVGALGAGLEFKKKQISNKLQQLQIKLQTDSIEAVAATNDLSIASLQLERQRNLFDNGLVSQTQLEARNQTYQNALAKKMSADNKFINTRQELNIVRMEMNAIEQEYNEKISKTDGDRFQSLSEIASGEGEIAKLQNQYTSYSIRSGMYYIIAPQDGQIVQVKKAGIGEIVKESEMLLQIVPKKMQYAVELFIRPVDLPLVQNGQSVQFIFDGFPAIVFSGWPAASYGMFHGKIAAIEGNVNEEGKFRVLVIEDASMRAWPKELKLGTGANGMALLNNVQVWYELWRNINSFPPDYYQNKVKEKK